MLQARGSGFTSSLAVAALAKSAARTAAMQGVPRAAAEARRRLADRRLHAGRTCRCCSASAWPGGRGLLSIPSSIDVRHGPSIPSLECVGVVLSHLLLGGEAVGELVEHQVRIDRGYAADQDNKHPLHHASPATFASGEGRRASCSNLVRQPARRELMPLKADSVARPSGPRSILCRAPNPGPSIWFQLQVRRCQPDEGDEIVVGRFSAP